MSTHLRQAVNKVAQAAVDSKVTNNVITNNMVTRGIATAVTTILNDSAFQQWVAHGASEVANVLVKEEPAPIYNRSAPDPLSDSPLQAEQQVAMTSPVFDPGESIVDAMIDQAQDMAPQPEMEYEMEME